MSRASRDPRPVVHLPEIDRLLNRRYYARNQLELSMIVVGEDHSSVALAVAQGYAGLRGVGVVRVRTMVRAQWVKRSPTARGRGTYVPGSGFWTPSEHAEPREAARVYAPGAKHTRLMLTIPFDKTRPNFSHGHTVLGNRTQTMSALREVVLAAGARIREFELVAYESMDEPTIFRAYRDLRLGRKPLFQVGLIQDHWRRPEVLDRVLAMDAAAQSVPQTATLRELHLDLSPAEHLLVRHLIAQTIYAWAGAGPRARVNLNDARGPFRRTNSINNEILDLAAKGWIARAVREPAGWFAERGPKLRGLGSADLIPIR